MKYNDLSHIWLVQISLHHVHVDHILDLQQSPPSPLVDWTLWPRYWKMYGKVAHVLSAAWGCYRNHRCLIMRCDGWIIFKAPRWILSMSFDRYSGRSTGQYSSGYELKHCVLYGSGIEFKHCASLWISVRSLRKYFVHLNWIRLATNPNLFDSPMGRAAVYEPEDGRNPLGIKIFCCILWSVTLIWIYSLSQQKSKNDNM